MGHGDRLPLSYHYTVHPALQLLSRVIYTPLVKVAMVKLQPVRTNLVKFMIEGLLGATVAAYLALLGSEALEFNVTSNNAFFPMRVKHYLQH